MITDKQHIDHVLSRGVEAVLPTRDALAEMLASGKRIRLYCGFDPTAPSLHIGHALQLRKLREFQDLGHEVIMLVGSFTAMIGDPTDKGAARTPLSAEQVMENAKTWKKMASKFLRFHGENKAVVMHNHRWLGKLNLGDVVNLASNFTVQQMMERDMFQKRQKEGKPIYLHEFIYPLMQGYDSVVMDVDLEIGGNDQLFNMLAGRTLMKAMKQKEKFVLALKLLTNDEGKKMSKTEGGFIAIDDVPEDMYGKIMAMNDGMIVPYFEIVTDVPAEEITKIREELSGGKNPRDVKMALAKTVVAMFHGPRAASKAEKHFVGVIQNKEAPDEMPIFNTALQQGNALVLGEGAMTLVDVLVKAKLAVSNGEARRLIEQGGVTLDDVKIDDAFRDMRNVKGVLRRGKRQFVRLV